MGGWMHGREESMDGTCDAYGCMHVDVACRHGHVCMACEQGHGGHGHMNSNVFVFGCLL